MENSESADKPKSIVLDLLRRSRSAAPGGRWAAQSGALRPGHPAVRSGRVPAARATRANGGVGDVIFWVIIVGASGVVAVLGLLYLNAAPRVLPSSPSLVGARAGSRSPGWSSLLVVSTIVWVPVGVKIGMNPRLARYAQPVVQVLASFPANPPVPLRHRSSSSTSGIPLDYRRPSC